MTPAAPVLVLGGYGSLGSRIVRQLERLRPGVSFVIAGRDRGKAAALARTLNDATATSLDIGRADLGLPSQERYAAVVTALRDLSLNTLRFAQRRGIPYVALSDAAFEIGPLATLFAHHPAVAPVVLIGHSIGGVPALAALHGVESFTRVEEIGIGLVLDPRDPFGPGSAADMERIGALGPAPLMIDQGRWRWQAGEHATRTFAGVDGHPHVGHAVGLSDIFSLGRCGAGTIRVDVAEGLTATSRAGGPPSHEVIIEMTGDHVRLGHGRFRSTIVDPEGYAALSARGIAIVVDALLGAGGRTPVTAGLHLPETIVEPPVFVQRLAELGIEVRSG